MTAKKTSKDVPQEKPVVETMERKPIETLSQVKEDISQGTAKSAPKKRGRPPKQAEPEPETLSIDSQTIKMAVDTLTKIVASRRGSHWLLDETELDNISVAMDRAAQQYFPLLGRHANLINLIGATAMIFGPRFLMEMELIKIRKGKTVNETPAE